MNVSPANCKVCRKFGNFFSSANSKIHIFKVITMYGSELFATSGVQDNVGHDSKKFV